MPDLTPTTAGEMAGALREASSARRSIALAGARSKPRLGGPAAACEVSISTAALGRVVRFDPRDLTISVEAGLAWRELIKLLSEHRLMLPLDPPRADAATVGGVVATNVCGARRRLYGTARDSVIGLQYATLDGTLAESGGMVVKNVAGLDVQKALIGSFGKLTRTFVLTRGSAEEASQARDRVLGGVLQPTAVDVVTRVAGVNGYALLVRAGGSEALLNRYARELAPCDTLSIEAEAALWRTLDDFPVSSTYTVKVGHALTALPDVLKTAAGPVVARAGTGITYLGFDTPAAVRAWMERTAAAGWSRIIEWGPDDAGPRWPDAGADLAWMRRLKADFDPNGLLNPGRLHGRV
jgi:glycolate oxidase FAD binding subunit